MKAGSELRNVVSRAESEIVKKLWKTPSLYRVNFSKSSSRSNTEWTNENDVFGTLSNDFSELVRAVTLT